MTDHCWCLPSSPINVLVLLPTLHSYHERKHEAGDTTGDDDDDDDDLCNVSGAGTAAAAAAGPG